jgi:AcrR family transcriptional regulator
MSIHSTSPAAEDLTAKARIRNAALTQFAQHGFGGASIRGIAKAAGVSPGLVQHHFGSKEGLRDACDDYVLATIKRGKTQGVENLIQAESFAGVFAEMEPIVDYLMTSLSSGSDVSAHWFDEITAYVHEVFTAGEIGPALGPEDDSLAIAAVQAAMALGVTVFYRHLQRTLADSPDQADIMLRVACARLFLASDRVVGPETKARLQEGLDRYAAMREGTLGREHS